MPSFRGNDEIVNHSARVQPGTRQRYVESTPKVCQGRCRIDWSLVETGQVIDGMLLGSRQYFRDIVHEGSTHSEFTSQ
jgi:hypothetical protein